MIDSVRCDAAVPCLGCDKDVGALWMDLFCTPLCREEATLVRYWRRKIVDGTAAWPAIAHAINVRLKLIKGGGYNEAERGKARRHKPQLLARSGGLCEMGCGRAGEEIDHRDGDSNSLNNLQWLCTECHRVKTETRMRLDASPHSLRTHADIHRRAYAPAPLRECDNEQEWARRERRLREARRRSGMTAIAATSVECEWHDALTG